MRDENDNKWLDLPVELRAELLKAGIGFPGETPTEAACRVKAQLNLLDDEDICALCGVTEATLEKHRVSGTGPRPIRVLRRVFYTVEDVREWMLRQRDVAVVAPKRGAGR